MELDGVRLQLKEIVKSLNVQMAVEAATFIFFLPYLYVKFKCAKKNSSVATTAV